MSTVTFTTIATQPTVYEGTLKINSGQLTLTLRSTSSTFEASAPYSTPCDGSDGTVYVVCPTPPSNGTQSIVFLGIDSGTGQFGSAILFDGQNKIRGYMTGT